MSYSLRDEETRKRELSALEKLSRLPCLCRLVLTYDEQATIEDRHYTIEVMPCWRWVVNFSAKT